MLSLLRYLWLIIINIRHFSGKIKTRILLALLSSVIAALAAVSNHITLLPGNFATLAIFHCILLKKSAISLVDYAYALRTCALESRIARSVTMERRSFARTLLWRNNHTHGTLLACSVSKISSNQHWIFILDTVSIDNRWNHIQHPR